MLQQNTCWNTLLIRISFFGTQEGDFSLSLVSISAAKASKSSYQSYRDDPNAESARSIDEINEKNALAPKQSWMGWLLGFCGVVA